jgi:acyl-coenzyme A thioesterase PaaI-like protein
MDGYFDLESVSNGRPMDLLKRIFSGELIPNAVRMASASWEVLDEGSVVGRFPNSPWFSVGSPSLYGGAIAWFAEAAMGNAIYSTLEPGEVFATLDMNVRFTRPAVINRATSRLRPSFSMRVGVCESPPQT